MAEDEKPGRLTQALPYGAAMASLLVNFPALPGLVFGESKAFFKGLGAFGLIVGLGFGWYLTNSRGRFRTKREGLLAMVIVAVAFIAVYVRYGNILGDAENNRAEIIGEYFVIDMLVGFLLFVVAPAARLMIEYFRSAKASGEE
jgi:hypothetical protein